jgi:hypothetical protein
MEDYLPILRSLVDAGVEFAAIGTWALKAYFPEKLKNYVLHDCDVALAPDLENVRRAIHHLNENGWQTDIWGECVDANVSPDFLRGKFYIRATQGKLTLDLTYECLIDWQETWPEIRVQDGIPLASIAQILKLKHAKALQLGQESELERWLSEVGIS